MGIAGVTVGGTGGSVGVTIGETGGSVWEGTCTGGVKYGG